MRSTITRIALPALIMACLVVPAAALTARLPDPIAVHWSLTGRPNGHLPWWACTLLVAILWGAGWTALLRTTVTPRRRDIASVYAIGGLLLAAQNSGLWANLDAGTWRSARHLPGYVLIPGIVACAAVASGIGWCAAPPDEPGRAEEPYQPDTPERRLRPGEQVVWAGGATNFWMLLVVPVIALIGRVTTGGERSLVVTAVIAVAMLGFCTVHVVVGPEAVVVSSGLAGWPRRRVRLQQIRSAGIATVAPLTYGGWGLRRRAGRTAVIVRGGPALDLLLVDGRRFVVTVDGAAEAAALVNGYLARTATATG